jgi:hypothetical protein
MARSTTSSTTAPLSFDTAYIQYHNFFGFYLTFLDTSGTSETINEFHY